MVRLSPDTDLPLPLSGPHTADCPGIRFSHLPPKPLQPLLRLPGHLPAVHVPPPPPDLRSDSLARKLRTFVPMLPPRKHQRPQRTLYQRQQHLVPRRDPRHLLPRLRVLYRREV